MVRRGSHGTDRWTRWAVALAVLPALLVCAPAALAAPKTIHGTAYEHMKKFMGRYDKDGFSKVVDFGGAKTYRVKLASLKLKVNAAQEPLAKYDPKTRTITFKNDPRKVKGADAIPFGETVWHEVTHALEHQHGDFGIFDSKKYAERNVDYMTHLIRTASPFLDEMERQAKDGASVEKLRWYWDKYLAEVENAKKLDSTKEFPPDLALMRSWFGFREDAAVIKALYLSGKVLPGKLGANLRKMLSTPAFKPGDWQAIWHGTNYGDLTLTASGNSVTGVFEYPYWAEQFQGTISADASTMTGTWLHRTNLVNGPQYWVVSFSIALHRYDNGNWYFDGTYTIDADGSLSTFDFTGWHD